MKPLQFVALLTVFVLGLCLASALIGLSSTKRAEPTAPPPPQTTWAEARPSLRLEVSTPTMLGLFALQNPLTPRLITRPLSPGLVSFITSDEGAVDEELLAHWGQPVDELFRVARENSEPLVPTTSPFATARTAVLAFPEKAGQLPNHERLVFEGARGVSGYEVKTDEDISSLLDGAEIESLFLNDDLTPETQGLDGKLWVLRDGGFVEWQPPPAFAPRYRAIVEDCEDVNLAREASVFGAANAIVRSYTSEEPPRSSFVSVPLSAKTRFPPADFIVFERNGRWLASARWSEAATKLPGMIERVPGTVLTWFRLKTMPTDAQLEALGFAPDLPDSH